MVLLFQKAIKSSLISAEFFKNTLKAPANASLHRAFYKRIAGCYYAFADDVFIGHRVNFK